MILHKKPIRAICLVSLFLTLCLDGKVSAKTTDLDSTYRSAQRKFLKKNYKEALPLLEKYLSESKGRKYKRERLFWIIDQIGRIHLRINRNPDAAIKFFEKLIVKDDRLSEAEEDDIGAWIAAAKDWKKNPVKPGNISSEKKRFKKGKEYFQKGRKKLSFPADDAGNAYFSLASNYLVPFINKNDRSPEIAEALLMMGEIRVHLRTDPEYWNENFNLKEVIRRFPHTKTSQKAYLLLENDIRFGYTGSSGDNTPPSIVTMLKSYKILSGPQKKVSRGKKG